MFPVVIIVYNQYTYVRDMVNQLDQMKSIIILDNASTFQPLLDYYKTVKARVYHMNVNYGHRVWQRPEIQAMLPEKFIITDPDLRLNPNMPVNYESVLEGLSEQFKSPRTGLAISLDGPLRTDVKLNNQTIAQWEARFWHHPMLVNGQQTYFADLDTTFCLINKKYSNMERAWEPGIRVAGDFTCIHRPWMVGWENELMPGEMEAYMAGNTSTNWGKSNA